MLDGPGITGTPPEFSTILGFNVCKKTRLTQHGPHENGAERERF